MPIFVLAVLYAGLFSLFGGKDAERVPRRPHNWRRIIGEILAGLVVASLIAAIVYAHDRKEVARQANIELENRKEAKRQANIELERRKEAKRQENIKEEASKHMITSSEIDFMDLRLERPQTNQFQDPFFVEGYHLTGRIRNRSANYKVKSITLTVTLREKEGSPDILGRQTVQIRVEVPSHQTRAISQSIFFPNLPQLTQYALTYDVTEIRGDFDPYEYLRQNLTPTPSPKP
jgi:hypothetical protein